MKLRYYIEKKKQSLCEHTKKKKTVNPPHFQFLLGLKLVKKKREDWTLSLVFTTAFLFFFYYKNDPRVLWPARVHSCARPVFLLYIISTHVLLQSSLFARSAPNNYYCCCCYYYLLFFSSFLTSDKYPGDWFCRCLPSSA